MDQTPPAGAEPSLTPPPAGQKNNNRTLMAVLAYLLFFVPLLTGDAKKDSFVMYHTKQGLVLFIAAVIVNFLGIFLPFYVWAMFGWILSLGILVLFIFGIMNAVNGKEEPLPLIGQFASKFKF
jgi:uncharacterized membrane protein